MNHVNIHFARRPLLVQPVAACCKEKTMIFVVVLILLVTIGLAVRSARAADNPYPEMEWAMFGGTPPPVAYNETPIALDSVAGVVIPIVRLKIAKVVVADLAATPLPVSAVPGLALDIAEIAHLRTVLCLPAGVAIDTVGLASTAIGVADTAGRRVDVVGLASLLLRIANTAGAKVGTQAIAVNAIGTQPVPVSALSTADIQTASKIVDAWRHLYGAKFDSFQQIVLTKPGDVGAMVASARFAWWESQVKAGVDVPAVALPESLRGVRWVAEVNVPASLAEYQNVLAELAWFRARGYGGLLFVWSGETANLAMWHDLAARCQAAGWKIAFAFGPPETQTDTGAYFDPGAFQVAAAGVLPFADCALLGWRAASQPHWDKGNAAFVRVLASELRKLKPGLPLVGEAYMHADRHFSVTAPPGAAASLVVNSGAEQFIPAGVAGLAVAAGAREPLLCLVTGVAPYWKIHPRPVTLSEVAAACRRTENNFLAASWFGTVTLAGDGAGERLGNTDSLCKTHWRDVQTE